MRQFYSIMAMAVRQQFHYRLALWAGLVTNFFFGILRAALFLALYAGNPSAGDFSILQVLGFVGISQALIAFMSVFGYFDIMKTVYSGAVGADLLKPVPFFTYWLSRDLGRSLVNLLTRGVVLVVLFNLIFKVPFLIKGWNWIGFVLALSLSWLVSFSWRFLVNLVSFWTPDGVGFGRAAYSFSQLLSGFIVPLGLMPNWFQKAAYFTPFPSMVAVPADIFLGRISGGTIFEFAAIQLGWFIALFALGQVVMRLGVHRLVVQGG